MALTGVLAPVALALALAAPAGPVPAQFQQLTADEVLAAKAGKPAATVVDVRTPQEYAQVHVAGAINVPADRLAAEAGRLPGDRAAALIFYCRGPG